MEYKSPAIHRTPLYRAKSAYYSISQRCLNKNGKNPSYAHVELRITKEEWLAWAVPKYEEFNQNHPNESPNVARIGDKGHYEIGNIELVTAKKNRESQVMTTTPLVHGTMGGYYKEKRWGLEICELCRTVFREYTKNYNLTHIRKRDRDKIGSVTQQA
jgi:hypothetical protein